MQRDYYLKLAEAGLRFPVGADLVLKEHPDHEAILRDGVRLGQVIAEAAARFHTPLAMPVMDLMLEKALLLRPLGVPEADIPTWHFAACPTPAELDRIRQGIQGPLDPRLQANVDAVRYIAANTDLLPVGMSIGPFSLMTKLLAEPITPVYLAGLGMTGDEEPEVKTVETLLELSVEIILRSFEAQAAAGAKAFFVAEPAANKVFISPNQLAAGSDVFERLGLHYMRRIKARMDAAGVDLIFHCCGELVDDMVRGFASLRPVILSLGSSRQLWEDAALVPKDIVLYGNLPSKQFYSDDLITIDGVRRQADELAAKMRAVGHPHIVGSECDVLCVHGCEHRLMAKALAIATAR